MDVLFLNRLMWYAICAMIAVSPLIVISVVGVQWRPKGQRFRVWLRITRQAVIPAAVFAFVGRIAIDLVWYCVGS
jgi:hypothetical protein